MEGKFEVRNSLIDGRGIFATKPFKKGEAVCLMEGERISIPELDRRFKAGQERLTDPLQINVTTYLDLDEPYVLINHSCEPNTAIRGENELFAVKDINAGDEITFDYSLTEWTNDNDWSGYDEWNFDCNCGSKFCRKVIGEFDLLPKDLQNKVVGEGLVQNFILEKFLELSK